MGNVCSCGRASSTSDSDAQNQQLLQDLRTNPDISSDNLESLMNCMDFIFSKLKQPNEEASSSSSSERVAQSATIGRSLVGALSTQIESQVTATTSKCRISGSRMKQYVREALNSRTMKLVGDVLDKTQKIPYVGVASCIVVYVLEQYEKSSSNTEETMKLLEHLYVLVKCIKHFRLDENANQLQDMLGFIVKCTVSLDQRINQSSIKRFAFAYPDSTELQSMRDELMLTYQNTQLKTLMDIYKNIRRLPQAPSKVYCASAAVGIEREMEEVKKKLNMGEASKKVVIIWGIGGIGKTTLGDDVYNSVVDKSKYSRCRLEMDIKSTNVPKLQFDLLSQVFQESEEVLNAREGQGRISKAIEKSSKQSKSKPLFLYIDNASTKGEVDDLLPINTLTSLPEGSKIMVTTRNLNEVEPWLHIPGFECENFKMEEIREAKKILSYYALGNENGSFDEDVDVGELLNLCMGVPLIIEMAAKKLRNLDTMGMAEACRHVIEHMQRLKNEGDWEEKATHRMVDLVYGQLPKSSQTMFLDIVFFFINWRRYKVVCIFGEIVIRELEGAGLLSTNQEGRLKVHDIIMLRAHAISNGSRICDREAWELLKAKDQDFNAIVGLHIDVKEEDLKYVSKCDKIKVLILKIPMSQGAVKVHLPTSVEILCLKGPFIHNENLLNAFKVLIMKMNEFEKGFTSYRSFRKVKYLDMVNCKGIDIPTCFSHGLSSCKRLRLSDAKLQMLPHGNDKVLYKLESLKLDKCISLRSLPDIFIQMCSFIKIASMTNCESLNTLPHSFGKLENLEKLDLSKCFSLGSLCGNFGSLSKLRELDISNCQSLRSLPPSFGLLQNLEKLKMRGCKSLESLGENFDSLSKLRELDISYCESLQALPPSFGQLKNLENLSMDNCKSLKTLGENFDNLSKLKELEISHCESLQALPASFGQLENLERLIMDNCKSLKILCENFGSLSKLKELDIRYCRSLQALPTSFGLLENLEELDMSRCESLGSLGEKFGSLSKLKELDISDCENLRALPPSFGQLENLERLIMYNCKSLKTLGENFGSLSKLEELDISYCKSLKALPTSFGLLENLEELDMTGCESLGSLGENFGSLSNLKELEIEDCNSLETLPLSFGLLKNLEKLRISKCPRLKSLGGNSSNLQEVRQLQFCQSLQNLSLNDCPVLENLPEGLRDSGILWEIVISGCKNMKISADNLPPLNYLVAVGIDTVDEKMVDDLLRLPTLLFLRISTKFFRYIQSYAWKRTPLPFILTIDDCDSDFDSNIEQSESMIERMLGGGGGEYWRMEGEDDLVREDGHSWQRNNVAVIITGLNLVSQECREAVHRMAEEGREIIYVDTGISRWKRYEAVYEERGRAFSGEVELNEDDKQMMKGMLKQLQLPKGCVPGVWTSPFPKTCLSLSAILYRHIASESDEECDEENDHIGPESRVLKMSSVVDECDEEFSEEYDKERSCQFGEVVALPSLGISDICSKGLCETITSMLEEFDDLLI